MKVRPPSSKGFPPFKDIVSFWAVTAFILGTIYAAEVVSAIVLIWREAQ